MFDGTVISKGESSLNEEEVNVEDDDTTTYGPAQYVPGELGQPVLLLQCGVVVLI